MRSDVKRITREASRATGTFLFFPKGALTHHPGGAVVFPLEIVRSPRGIRLLRKPDGQCHSSADLLSVSTQLVCSKCSQNTVASTDGIPPTARTKLPPAALSAVMTITIADSHFLFEKRNRNFTKGLERGNGDLSFGSQGHQPRRRPFRLRRFCLSKLLPNFQ